jgi:hypothetical protein
MAKRKSQEPTFGPPWADPTGNASLAAKLFEAYARGDHDLVRDYQRQLARYGWCLAPILDLMQSECLIKAFSEQGPPGSNDITP